MMAQERMVKQHKRLVIMKRIYDIEMANCRVCPNRKNNDRTPCEGCPVMKQLTICGSELLLLSFREQPAIPFEEPHEVIVKKKPGRRSNEEKERMTVLTREIFLQERANGMWVRDIQHKYKLSRTALQHYLKKWGFRYLSQDQAKELLKEVAT